jgi:hypothetical protein
LRGRRPDVFLAAALFVVFFAAGEELRGDQALRER